MGLDCSALSQGVFYTSSRLLSHFFPSGVSWRASSFLVSIYLDIFLSVVGERTFGSSLALSNANPNHCVPCAIHGRLSCNMWSSSLRLTSPRLERHRPRSSANQPKGLYSIHLSCSGTLQFHFRRPTLNVSSSLKSARQSVDDGPSRRYTRRNPRVSAYGLYKHKGI